MSLLDLFIPVRIPIKGARRISENRGGRSDYNRDYYLANKAHIQARSHAYYERHSDGIRARAKRYYEQNKERILASRRAKTPKVRPYHAALFRDIPRADRPCVTCGDKRYVTPGGLVAAYCLPCKLARQRKRHAERKAER